jgi:hypothetical protein
MINPLRIKTRKYLVYKKSKSGMKSKIKSKIFSDKINYNLRKYFSQDYFEARDKFRKATTSMTCWSEKVKDNLTIDFAYSNPINNNSDNNSDNVQADKLLILVSGVHGVEGYAGSALQLLFLDKVYSGFKNSFAVLLIHAYNPYGFENNRRVNENNVDLNRNCLENYNLNSAVDKKFREIFLKHKKVFSPECPRRNKLIEESKYSFILAKVLFKHGIEGAIQAGSLGQNLYPKGVGFIGLNEEKSTKIFKETINKFSPQFKKVILLDIHTGLGRRNSISSYAENPKSYPDFWLVKRALKNLKSKKLSKISSLSHSGAITKFFYDNVKSKEKISIIMEIGTVSRVSPALSLAALSRANLEENQITHFGPKKRLEKARLNLKKAYFPDEKRFRKALLVKSEKLLFNLCSQIELM